MREPELLSFEEFVRRRGLSERTCRAFETDIRVKGLTFNYRTEGDWGQVLANFTAADRRRRHG